nr:unnamed protein product [Callosobruchus chinensis]
MKYRQRYHRMKKKYKLEKNKKNSLESNVERDIGGLDVPPNIKSKLVAAEALKLQIEKKYEVRRGINEKQEFAKCISGKIVKKYKCLTFINMGSYNLHFRKHINFSRKKTMTRKIKRAIIHFNEEDENSRMTPGKRDFITFKKVLNIIAEGSPDSLVKSICCEPVTEVCLQKLCKQCVHKELVFNLIDNDDNTSYKKWITGREAIVIQGKEKMVSKCKKVDISCTKRDLVN